MLKGTNSLGQCFAVRQIQQKKYFVDSGVFEEGQIIAVGLLRIDNLINMQARIRSKEKKTVCLFSFGHLTGNFINEVPVRNYYFSANDSYGFVKLFVDTHCVFAELALEYPEVEFLIKPKNFERGWISEIENVISRSHSLPIPNLSIINESAQSIMKRSTANIVFNSTTVIESACCCSETIVPIFAEAADDHSDAMYLTEFSGAYKIACSKSDLKSKMKEAIEGDKNNESIAQHPHKQMMLEAQVGNADGKSAPPPPH